MESSSSWRRLQEAFEGALDIETGEQRDEYLCKAFPDAPELLEDVRRMLRAHETADTLAIEKRLLNDGDAAPAMAGQIVGRYRLLRLLGRGGMGEVYEAERDDQQYRQRVALKLLRTGWSGHEAVARFRLERQILAKLSHPRIVPLLDGGVTEDGRPYLVLQYVQGQSITQYCESTQLSIERRLGLICEVARVVEFAHRNLVVHRDLKPSNILVTEEGEVRLLDFGVAKLLDASAEDGEIPATRAEVRLMTPGYASPEQILGAPITTATDIHALGILTYELLVGRRPYQVAGGDPVAEQRQIVEREAPPPPSERAQDARAAKKLRGDLDTIVAKALEKEPERRYSSAEEMARDIERYLASEPVQARRPSARYRLGKFIRRNRLASALAALSVLLLVAFSAVAAWQARRIARERDLARVEQEKSERVVGLLVDLFAVSNPEYLPGGKDLTVGEFLQRTERSALQATGIDVDVQARMKQVLGKAYLTRNQFDHSRALLTEALDLFRRSRGEEAPATADAYHDLALLAAATQTDAKVEPLLRASLERLRRAYGPKHEKVASAMVRLAGALPATEEHRRLIEASLEMRRSLSSAPTAGIAESVGALGEYYWATDQMDKAGVQFAEALRIWNQLYPAGHPEGLSAMNNLASVYARQGNYAKAIPLHASGVEILSRLIGPDTVAVAVGRGNLGVDQASSGDHRSAEHNFRTAVDMMQKLLNPDHLQLINTMRNLGRVLELEGQYPEAIRWLQNSADAFHRSRPDEPGTWHVESQLGTALFRAGRRAEAITKLRAAVDRLRSLKPDGHNTLADSQVKLGFVLLESGRRAESEPLFREALSYRRRTMPPNHPALAEAECGLAAASKPAGSSATCLPVFAAWGQADPEDVRYLKRIAGN